jgi:hypothetical protein
MPHCLLPALHPLQRRSLLSSVIWAAGRGVLRERLAADSAYRALRRDREMETVWRTQAHAFHRSSVFHVRRKWTSVYGSYFGAAEEVLADVRLAVAGVSLDERIRRGTLFPVRRCARPHSSMRPKLTSATDLIETEPCKAASRIERI